MTTQLNMRLPELVASSVKARSAKRMTRVRAMILLAGSLRPTPFISAIDRSRLDLPVTDQQTIMQRWLEEIELLQNSDRAFKADLRVLLDAEAPAPQSHTDTTTPLPLSVERDPKPFRGTAGLLHDVTQDYDDDDLILVANGGHVLLEPAMSLVPSLVGRDADVVLTSDPDGTPGGLMLIRVGVLRDIKPMGFLDFKEQALPRIARDHRVVVERRFSATGLPVRTLQDYIYMLRTVHREEVKPVESHDAFAEEWQPHFSLLEPGAPVRASATVHDSVVLEGGRVEEGAVVSRSIVCPGAVVPAGKVIVNECICNETSLPERNAR